MSATADVLERVTPAAAPVLARLFVGFLPVSETDRSTCGFCGQPSEGAPEPVGDWGLLVFTCSTCHIFDHGSEA